MEDLPRLVAIVDDDPAVCRALARLVRACGHGALSFDSGRALLCTSGPACPTDVLLDLHMPGLGGPPLIACIRTRWPRARIVMMSGLETPGSAKACLAAGAVLFLRKPILPCDLDRILAQTGRRAT
jgi:FixJ family two-component response regulator